MDNILLESIIDLICLMGETATWNGSDIEGQVMMTESTIELLSDIQERNEDIISDHFDDGVATWGNFVDIPIDHDKSVKIQLNIDNTGVYKDLDDMLGIQVHRYSVPELFYLFTEKFSSHQTKDIPIKIQRYLNTVSFVEVLDEVSDHVYEKYSLKNMIIFSGSKVDFTIKYDINHEVNLTDVNEFQEFVTSQPHQEKKALILKKIISDSLNKVESKKGFQTLLSIFPIIYKRLKDDYDLFLSEFSFDKIREEAENRKLTYTQKINDLISDIHNKLLAIPVALLLAASQIEETKAISAKNVAVLASALLLTFLLHNLVKNQKSTLHAIKDEIDSQREKLKNNYASIYEKLSPIYDFLTDRYNHQNKLLMYIYILIWVWLFFIVVMFSFQTQSIWHPVSCFYNQYF